MYVCVFVRAYTEGETGRVTKREKLQCPRPPGPVPRGVG